jgi:hypothetical protein
MIPAGMRAWQHSDYISMFRDLVLEVEPNHILETLEGTLDLAEVFAPRFMFFNPNLLRIAELMASECEPGKPQDVLYGDSLSVALLIGLSRLGRATLPRKFRGGLAPWQTKRVLEYLDAHINASVSLKNSCRLSPAFAVPLYTRVQSVNRCYTASLVARCQSQTRTAADCGQGMAAPADCSRIRICRPVAFDADLPPSHGRKPRSLATATRTQDPRPQEAPCLQRRGWRSSTHDNAADPWTVRSLTSRTCVSRGRFSSWRQGTGRKVR